MIAMAEMRDDERVWLHHPETDAWFECPAAAVDAWKARGWEVADPADRPAEPNPVVEELAAFQAELATAAEEPPAEDTGDEAEETTTTRRTRRAASASQED